VLLALPAFAVVALFFIAPLALLGRVSLYEGGNRSGFGIGTGFYRPGTWTLGAYRDLLQDPYFHDIAGFTVRFAATVAVASVVLGFVLAWLIARLPPAVKLAALGAVWLPKLANVLVLVYGLELLLGTIGPVNGMLKAAGLVDAPLDLYHNYTGTLIGEIYLVLPYDVLLLVTALDRIDPLLAPAARGLGAGPWRTFRQVTLPLMLPTLSLAFLLSLIFALGAFVSPYLLGGPEQFTLAVDIERQTFENLNWPRGAAEAILTLAALLAVWGCYGGGAAAVRARRQRSST
jgi:ABC-type spermidine/putrescine transport system permease subunit I